MTLHPSAPPTGPTAHCTRCGSTVSPGDRFCVGCGASLVVCSACGRLLQPGATACATCGAEVGGGGPLGSPPRDEGDAGEPAFDAGWAHVVARLREILADEFEILGELGYGGMAAVFLARELALQRHVALKVLAPGLVTGEGMVERFRQEAVTVANLQHPHIVTVHGVRVADELPLYVMQYVRGRSVDRALREHGSFSPAAVRGILCHVGSALDFAHRRGVIHRDIKPGNILVNTDGDALVTDFGIAKISEAPGYTRAGTVIGTPAYMSPEQCVGTDVSGASDQYSLGVVAYEMLAGRPPFVGSNLAIMRAHVDAAPSALSDARPDVPRELEAAVMRMLAKRPTDRFPDLPDALAALAAHPFGSNDPVRSELRTLAGSPSEEVRLAALLQQERVGSSAVPGRSRARSATPSAPRARSPAAASARSGAAPAELAELRIVGPSPTVEVGDSMVLEATALDAAGASIEAPRVRWDSKNPEVATVDAAGVLSAHRPGLAEVAATMDRVSASCEITVVAPAVASIDVDLPAQVRAGTRTKLSASARDRRGAVLDATVRWSSRTPAVATVSAEGVLSGKWGGTAILVAEANGFARAVTITVSTPPVVEVVIDGVPPTLVVGATVTVRRVIRTVRGPAVEEEYAIEWRSSDPTVATVSASGVITAHAPGHVVVTAVCNGVSGSLSVAVANVPAASVVITAPPPSLRLGESVTLRATVSDAAGHRIDRPMAWRSTDPSVAAVDSRGRVTAHAEGWAIITAQADGAVARAEVVVRPHFIPRSAAGRLETRRSALRWVVFLLFVAAVAATGWWLTR